VVIPVAPPDGIDEEMFFHWHTASETEHNSSNTTTAIRENFILPREFVVVK
jgi:hypothetical protein